MLVSGSCTLNGVLLDCKSLAYVDFIALFVIRVNSFNGIKKYLK